MISEILRRAFSKMMEKPIKLWGLSLLSSLLMVISLILGGPVLGISVISILILKLGMSWVYLDGYRGLDVSSRQLFEGFRNIKKSFAGMAWYRLVCLLWRLIPIAGIVFYLIRWYEFCFVPYLMRENPDISAIDITEESRKRTDGYKWNMFACDLLITLCSFGILVILLLLSNVKIIGTLFSLLFFIYYVILIAFFPLLCGLVHAAWYDEISKQFTIMEEFDGSNGAPSFQENFTTQNEQEK